MIRLHGLDIETELDLAGRRSDATDIDVAIVVADERTVTDERPAATAEGLLFRVARDDDDGTFLYAVRRDEVVRVVAPGVGAFSWSDGSDRIDVTVDPDGVPGLVDVVAAGAVLTLWLQQRGSLVLHASAVVHAGLGVAFTGTSGQGKSTTAAMCAAAGAALVADDVLRVHDAAMFGGATRLRLRPDVAIADLAPDTHETTPDGRTQVGWDRTLPADPLPLHAVIVPIRTNPEGSAGGPHTTDPRLVRLHPRDAFVAMMRAPRLPGLVDAGLRAETFGHVSELVERVPVFAWVAATSDGPSRALGQLLLDAVAAEPL